MNLHSDKARKLFKQGYNCAQSVFCAFADELGIDFETALKLSSSFGGEWAECGKSAVLSAGCLWLPD